MQFTVAGVFLWLCLSAQFSLQRTLMRTNTKSSVNVGNSDHMISSLCQHLAVLMVSNILVWAEVHRAGKHLAISELCGRPANLLTA